VSDSFTAGLSFCGWDSKQERRMTFFKLGDNVHHYLTEGTREKPALVFANSLGSDLRIWDGVVSRMGGSFHSVRYDKRGHGLSDAPKPPYRIEELARDLFGLLDMLAIKEAVICGISVGGLIAQAMALNYPERVRGLILCDTGARIGSVESWEQRIAMVRGGGLQSIEAVTMERWFSKGFRARCPADVRGYANMLLTTNVDGYIGTCCALRDADFHRDVTRLKQPALVLSGAEDIATPPELGRELAGLIPGAQFSTIDDAGHLPCIEQPDAVAERIIKFFREVQFV
jgi:3-oxoadipate enol-lactonase